MTSQLARATLIPYADDGKTLLDDDRIVLDFNPESLAIRVHSGQQRDRGRRGNQQVQHVGNSSATLSFDAIFDSTRPKADGGGQRATEPAAIETLDVRYKTARIANLLQVVKKGKKPAPRRIRFHWGVILFDGVVQSFNETLDYFAPSGVPLRSKVSIGITEQDFRYRVQPGEAAASARRPATRNDANTLAANNNLDSLFDLTAGGGFGLDASLDLRLDPEAEAHIGAAARLDLAAELGVNVDLDASAGAGIGLSAEAAVDLFGGAALDVAFDAAVDLGAAIRARLPASFEAQAGGGGIEPTRWAPEGPRPGTAGAERAARVIEARATGAVVPPSAQASGAFSATVFGPSAASTPAMEVSAAPAIPGVAVRPPITPLAVRGSPPLAAARFGPPPPAAVFSRRRMVPEESGSAAARRPRWEGLPDDGADDRPAALGRRGSAGPESGCSCSTSKRAQRW